MSFSHNDEYITTSDAKKQHFLSAADMQDVPYYKPGGWGCGQLRYYRRSNVLEAALDKHGEQGLRAKLERRAKRQEKQRHKQIAARVAEQRLAMNNNNNTNGGVLVDLSGSTNEDAAAATAVAQVDPKELKELRKQIRRSFKPYLSWDYLNTKNAPNGTTASAQLLRVTQDEYCTLIGRPNDPQLTTLVKRGAWYSVQVPFGTVMDSDDGICGGGGRYGCNSDLGIDPEIPLTVKYQPSTQTLSVKAFIQHVDTFGCYNF